ncbi:helix-turn-helix transcriptional regulator [Lachnospiraceae bacterium 46-61]
MDKSTDNLFSEIKDTKDIDLYLEHNQTVFLDNPFIIYLNQLLSEKSLKKSDLISYANISKQYLYELFTNKKKKPSRDTVIKLAFALHLNLEETNLLLKKAGFSSLYPKIKRESVIIYCILKKESLISTNISLHEKQLDILK